jgi:hypothetical protein
VQHAVVSAEGIMMHIHLAQCIVDVTMERKASIYLGKPSMSKLAMCFSSVVLPTPLRPIRP